MRLRNDDRRQTIVHRPSSIVHRPLSIVHLPLFGNCEAHAAVLYLELAAGQLPRGTVEDLLRDLLSDAKEEGM
jgi:hypothetical protein